MSRVITVDGPGNVRNYHRRTVAEALRRLSQKRQLDEEAKDLAALIVFSLQGIADTVEQTAETWDKRNYYLKAERFREQWHWLDPLTDELSTIIYEGRWHELPAVLVRLMPHFADITVKQMTRPPELWKGAYKRFMESE